MFNFFKKKSKVEQLQEQYKKLLEESFRLSKTDRTESDKKQVEANEILKQIESIQNAG